jgi:SAM-dependent methyltransferase
MVTTPASPLEPISDRFDGPGSEEYRRHDEIAIALGGSYTHYSSILRELTASPRRALRVLEVGCGTGRYFHCLANVEKLVGFDIAPEMVRRAADPVRKPEITARTIELQCADVSSYDPGDSKFDLIYSIGVLGEYCPLDSTVVRRLAAMLAPGGTLFVTAVDSASRISPPIFGKPSLQLRAMRKVFKWLPHAARVAMNRRLSPFYVTRTDIERAFSTSGMTLLQVSRYIHPSGWKGTHWDILATAPAS